MRLAILFVVLVGAGMLAVASVKAPAGFFSTWAEVQTAAQANHKLIFLHFTTDWCPWCRKIETETYTDARVKAALADFAKASLDCTVPPEQEPTGEAKINLELYAKLEGEGFPFLVMLSEDGTVVLNTISSYLPPAQFIGELAVAKATMKDYRAFQDYAKTADQQGYEYTLRAMKMMARVSQHAQSITLARRLRALDPQNSKGDAAEACWILLQAIPVDQWDTDGKAVLGDIKRFDARNEKGVLEKALMTSALNSYSAHNDAQAIAILKALFGMNPTLQNRQDDYGLLGVAQAASGDKAAAIATLKKAIAMAPNSPRGKWLKARLEELK